jgi:hypothetical protein
MFTVALALVGGSAAYAKFPIEKLPEPDPAKAPFDDACAMFAAARVSGYHDEKEPYWIATCSHHPDRGICDAARRFIEDSIHKPVPELVCGNKGAAPVQRPKGDPGRPAATTPTTTDPNAPATGRVTLYNQFGYVRLVFRFDRQVAVSATTSDTPSGAILILAFPRPVSIDAETLVGGAPDLINAVRLDFDKQTLRIALGHRVKLQIIPSNDRVIVDLLPENWTGPMPADTR